MRTIRITFVLPRANLSGGVRVVAEYARRLTARGHEVSVVSRAAAVPSLRAVVTSLARGCGWPSRDGGSSHLEGVPCTFVAGSRPVTDADVPDADVVVATWWETALWVAALAPRKGRKVYFLQHDERVFAPNADIAERVRRTWSLPMQRIAVSRWIAETLEREAGTTASVVPNGVDLEHFRAPPRGRHERPTMGLMYSTLPFKGCDVALAALAAAATRIPHLQVVAFGLEPVAARMPLPADARFHLRPAQAAIPALYADCDAWLCASRSEGFGLPVLEAMACRTPVIATPAGAAAELLRDGGGLLVGSEDIPGMAAAIERIASSTEGAWRALSDAAHATAAQHGWQASVVAMEQQLSAAADWPGR